MSDSSTEGDSERKTQLEEFYFQRRILFGCTISLLFGTIFWIIAVSTNRWFIVNGGDGKNFLDEKLRCFNDITLKIFHKISHWMWRCLYIASQQWGFSVYETKQLLVGQLRQFVKTKSWFSFKILSDKLCS